MAKPQYLMEGESEWQRLVVKGDTESTAAQLLATGLGQNPRAGFHAIDAGCGAGFVSRIMSQLLAESHPSSRLTMLDTAASRLEHAKQRLVKDSHVEAVTVECDLSDIPLADNSADYVFCRFVFEYLADPKAVFEELLRVTKPGGKLVIGDLDYNCMTHYPIAADLEAELHELMNLLNSKKLLDPYIGRKLYSYYHSYRLSDIQVRVIPHHLFYGELKDSDDFNWTEKIERLIEFKKQHGLQLSFDLETFKTRFLNFLRSPARFSYTPLILVEGVKRG